MMWWVCFSGAFQLVLFQVSANSPFPDFWWKFEKCVDDVLRSSGWSDDEGDYIDPLYKLVWECLNDSCVSMSTITLMDVSFKKSFSLMGNLVKVCVLLLCYLFGHRFQVVFVRSFTILHA